MSLPTEPPYITISGLIGVGKSTLAKSLGEHMSLRVYTEPVSENPYLASFYADKRAHAFAMQIYLLNERFKQQQQIVWSGVGSVQDRSIYEDSVFALMLMRSGVMSALNYETYCALFGNMAKFMKQPTLIVHLDVSPEEALRRIRERGRACEAAIDVDYLRQLRTAYEEFLENIARTIPVLRINYEHFASVEDMARSIQTFAESIGRIHTVGVPTVLVPHAPRSLVPHAPRNQPYAQGPTRIALGS